MKIGVLADTHIPDRRRALPPRVIEMFATVELVLHAGDLTTFDLLDQLHDCFGLVFAVPGEADAPDLREELQEKSVLEFGSIRIGLIHGYREPSAERGLRLKRSFRPFSYTDDYLDFISSQFKGVDAIVFGHTHVPYAQVHNGVFMFNPGTLDPAGSPTAGIIEVAGRGISGRILTL